MKKRVLFSACALAACFAACTNDDFQSAVEGNNTVVTEIGETVGADLVSKGMTINVQDAEADTKMSATGAFTNGDIIGLAAYNLNKSGGYGQTQNKGTWDANTDNGDKVIYNIPSFETEDNGNTWTTMANIYQGPYFAYYPWTREGFQKEMVVTPNAPYQTGDFAADRYNNRFQISAQDFIEAGQGINTATGALEWDFCLVSPLNQYAVVPNPNDYITANDYLKAMYITSMTVKTNAAKAVIVSKGTVHPQAIPHVVRSWVTGEILPDETRKAMDAALELMGEDSYIDYNDANLADYVTTSMGEEGKESKYFTLAGGENLHQIRVFSFPITKALKFDTYNYAPSVEFVVKGNVGNWVLGTFTVDKNQPASATLIENLKKLYGDDAEWSMTKILRNDKGNAKALTSEGSMSAVLTPQNFEPAVSNITEEEQWADLVNLVDALTGEGGKYKKGDKVTFTMGGDLTFNGNIPTPKNGVSIELATQSNSLTVTGESEWPANLITDKADNVVVAEGAKLYVGAAGTETAGQEIILDATIENNGTIYAGEMASISTKDSKALDNTNGTVFVEYGAYVYPSTEATVGEIAFEVKDSEQDTMAEINTLIQKDNQVFDAQNQFAFVNTLYVGSEEAQVTLDLNAKSKDEDPGDRYETEDTPAEYLLSLENVDIVLVDGKIVAYKGGQNDKVKNVISRSDVNEIQDVTPQGDINIEKGSTLTITSAMVWGTDGNDDKDLMLTEGATIDNKGTLKVTTTVWTTNVINDVKDQSLAEIDGDEYIYYTGYYTQGGTADGWILKNNSDEEVTFEDLTEAAQAVVTTFNAYVSDLKSQSVTVESFEDIAEWWNDNKASATTSWTAYKFYMAYSAWLSSVGFNGLSESAPYGNLTAGMFKNFETMTGFELAF